MKKNPDSNHAKITKENFKKKIHINPKPPRYTTYHNSQQKTEVTKQKKKIPPLGQNLEKKRKPRSDLVKK